MQRAIKSGWVDGDQPSRHLDTIVDRLRNDAVMSGVAQAFVRFLGQRESADYDHLVDLTRRSVRVDIERSDGAIASLKQASGTAACQSFASLILLRANG